MRKLKSGEVKWFAKGHSAPWWCLRTSPDWHCLTLAGHLSHSPGPNPDPLNEDVWGKRPEQPEFVNAPSVLKILTCGQNWRCLTQSSGSFSLSQAGHQTLAGKWGPCVCCLRGLLPAELSAKLGGLATEVSLCCVFCMFRGLVHWLSLLSAEENTAPWKKHVEEKAKCNHGASLH